MILRCDKIDQTDTFTLTVIFNKHLDKRYFDKSLERVRDIIRGRPVECFLFLGDPSVSNFCEESFDTHLLKDIVHLLKKTLGKRGYKLEIYTSLNTSLENCIVLKDLLDNTEYDWSVSTVYDSNNELTSFIRNAKFFYNTNKLKNVSCYSETHDISVNNVRLLSCVFKDIPVKLSYTKNSGCSKYTDITHKITYSDGSTKMISFREFDKLGISFRMFYCDISNHLEIDLSGKIYACSTALENNEAIGDDLDLLEITTKFRCPYKTCKHNDNMTTFFDH